MEKRDLKADLELLENGFYPSSVELIETAEHAIERALKAEALVRELVKTINGMRDDIALFETEKAVLKRAREVLSDD